MADTGQTRKEQRTAARAERAQAEAARARQRRRLWQLGGALGLAAVVVVAVVLAFGGGGDDGKESLKAGETLPGQFEANARFGPLDQSGITIGDPKAPYTLVEFADLQCPFCRDYSVDVMPTLVANYVRTGKMKMVFRNVAFISDDSTRAAQMAAAAARQNKLWEYIDIFYENQGEENTGYVTDEFLRKIGNAVKGLDVEKAMNERGLPAVTKQLNEAQTEWQSNGFTGTPSFLFGPSDGELKPLEVQSLDAEAFSSQIDKALQQGS